eukprot:5535999-Prymnesium_polylepis.2
MSTVADICHFRTAAMIHRAHLPEESPVAVHHAAAGSVAEVQIDGVFPRTACFIVVDVKAFAIRWTRRWFISLHTVQDAVQVTYQSARKHRVRRARDAHHSTAGGDCAQISVIRVVAASAHAREKGHLVVAGLADAPQQHAENVLTSASTLGALVHGRSQRTRGYRMAAPHGASLSTGVCQCERAPEQCSAGRDDEGGNTGPRGRTTSRLAAGSCRTQRSSKTTGYRGSDRTSSAALHDIVRNFQALRSFRGSGPYRCGPVARVCSPGATLESTKAP